LRHRALAQPLSPSGICRQADQYADEHRFGQRDGRAREHTGERKRRYRDQDAQAIGGATQRDDGRADEYRDERSGRPRVDWYRNCEPIDDGMIGQERSMSLIK
jgi:hypothetical protein